MTEKELTALEAIQKIKETEARAKALLELVQTKEIPQIIAEASEKAKAMSEQILAQAKEEAERRKQAILIQARKQVEAIEKETQQEIEKIENIAKEKFPLVWPSIRQQIIQEIKGNQVG
ncbi:MAG: hypothetical protein N3B16_03350 [Candidatus Aminicenantes bacterium]|nr:hypothetical protein [Candidatus Aminicenantes bacterium]